MKSVLYLTPSSFCMGVKRSISELEKVIEKHPDDQIFCVHELVHNPKVNKQFKQKGVSFVENLNEIQNFENVVVCFSAHGINREVILEAKKKYKYVYNLECPLVTKIYNEVDKFVDEGVENFLYIGKQDHQEGKNIVEYIKYLGKNVQIFDTIDNLKNTFVIAKNEATDSLFAVLSQTTLNYKFVVDILNTIKSQFPNAKIPIASDVCKATFDRQNAIIDNLNVFDTLIVIGGKESNNTKELYTIGVKNQKKSFFIENLQDLLDNHEKEISGSTIAITGGASTPDEDIREVFNYFVKNGYTPKME